MISPVPEAPEAAAAAAVAAAAPTTAMPASAPPAAPAAPVEPSTTAVPAAAPLAPAPAALPWDADVQAAFTDPAQQQAVSEFMKTKYAPYVSTLEQERAELRAQAMLFQQLEEAPAETLVEVISELYPDASAAEVQTFIEQLAAAPPAPAAPTAPEAHLTPEQQQAIQWAQQQQQAAAEQAQLTQYLSDAKPHLEANPDIPEAVFHRYVATTGGNFGDAIARYRTENPTPAPPPAPPAPPTGGSSPPSDGGPRNYGNDLDAVVSDMWASMRETSR